MRQLCHKTEPFSAVDELALRMPLNESLQPGPFLGRPPAQRLLTQAQLPGHRRDRPARTDDKARSLPPILRSEFTSCRAHKNTFPQNPRIPLLQVSTKRG
jgi:hypothetical protein